MPLKQSKQVRAGAAVPSFDGQEAMPVTAEYTIKAGDTTGDVIEFHGLPSNCLVTDMTVHTDGIGAKVDIGLLSGELGQADNARTCGQEFGAGQATDAAGVSYLAKSLIGVGKSDAERPWGVKLLGAPVVGKTLRITLSTQPAPVGL